MRKFLFIIAVLTFSISLSLITPSYAQAVTCRIISTNPQLITDQDVKINEVIVVSSELAAQKEYNAKIDVNLISDLRSFGFIGRAFSTDNSPERRLTITDIVPNGVVSLGSNNTFTAGQHTISVLNVGSGLFDAPLCTTTFQVTSGVITNPCIINITSSNGIFDTNSDINVSVKNLLCPYGADILCTRKLSIRQLKGTRIRDVCNLDSTFSTGMPIGRWEVGDYFLQIRDLAGRCVDFGDQELCKAGFKIVKPGESGGGVIPEKELNDPGVQPPAPPPCGSDNPVCNTAIGNINVNSIQDFIRQLFAYILAIAGIAAVGLFIYSGYQIMTSGGDKQKVQGARETITSAIAGLLFIIFSIAILEFIGVDILKFPGIGR